jgi:PAS domain S-box-containing protein
MQEKHHPIDLGDRERLPEKLARAEIPYTVFSSALDSSGFGLTQADPEARRYTYANAAFCNMFGYSIDELIGGDLTFADLVEPDDDAGRLGEFVRLVCGEIDICTVENRYIHKDGSVVPARAFISVLERNGANRAVLTTGIIIPLRSRSDELPSPISGFSFWTRDLRAQTGACSASFRTLLDLRADAPFPLVRGLVRLRPPRGSRPSRRADGAGDQRHVPNQRISDRAPVGSCAGSANR